MSCLTLFVDQAMPTPHAGQEIYLNSHDLPDGNSWIFGRASDCNYVIEDRTVSRHHCAIRYSSDIKLWELVDLNSTCGTWLNGRILPPLDATPINADDRFSLGTLRPVFVCLGEPDDTINSPEDEGETTELKTDRQSTIPPQPKTYGDAIYEITVWLVSGRTVLGKVERVLIVAALVAIVVIILSR